MPSLLLKNVDASLLREINYAAAKAELTQRDWAISVLGSAVGIKGAMTGSSPEAEAGPKGPKDERKANAERYLQTDTVAETPARMASAVPSRPKIPACTRCGESKGVVEWGPRSWHCNPCQINFPRAR